MAPFGQSSPCFHSKRLKQGEESAGTTPAHSFSSFPISQPTKNRHISTSLCSFKIKRPPKKKALKPRDSHRPPI
ncbi:unnamed protein product [Dovyalis caffra]|uniref:Uncharacterized protein n=1 Tax=Dovyalis caffra TaxID=77055 RepID=A0AAV1SKF4_9ROSI|nr:unnamed protein product [Dovyalis caffra]